MSIRLVETWDAINYKNIYTNYTHIDKRIFLNWRLRQFSSFVPYWFVWNICDLLHIFRALYLNSRITWSLFCSVYWTNDFIADRSDCVKQTAITIQRSSNERSSSKQQSIDKYSCWTAYRAKYLFENSIFFGICVLRVRPNMSSDTAKSVSFSFWILNNYCVRMHLINNHNPSEGNWDEVERHR